MMQEAAVDAGVEDVSKQQQQQQQQGQEGDDGVNDVTNAAAAAADDDGEDDVEDDGGESDGDAATTAAAAAAAAAGMRREWNFTLTFAHQLARVQLRCAPAWQHAFIDATRLEQLTRLDRDVSHCPLTPIVSYTDTTSVVTSAAAASAAAASVVSSTMTPLHHMTSSHTPHYPGNNNNNSSCSSYGGGGGDMCANVLLGRGRSTSMASATAASARVSVSTTNTTTTAAAAAAAMPTTSTTTNTAAAAVAHSDGAASGAAWWLEKTKHVELLYAHVAPDTTLARFCKECVRYMLHHAHLVAIDGDTNLAALRLGSKLDCGPRLGGHRSFHFYARLRNRHELADEHVYALGTRVHTCGYLALVRCSDVAELRAYVTHVFVPYYTDAARLQLDVAVRYHDVASVLLEEQQERYGELRYVDRDAAVSFALPMYPLTARPDFSPAKTVGVGSIACMTLEVRVHERLIDDAVVAEITGMPRYRQDVVVLCLDVEDVVRMNYPGILSIEQYSAQKLQRLLSVFADARAVGTATTVPLGHRAARSRTVTFYYEPLQSVVKAMLVSCLVGGYGVTALYLTRLTGGSFDTHLYLMQQLLQSVTYHVAAPTPATAPPPPPPSSSSLSSMPPSRRCTPQPHTLHGRGSGGGGAGGGAMTTTTAAAAAVVPFSRHSVTNIRLLEADLAHVYNKDSNSSNGNTTRTTTTAAAAVAASTATAESEGRAECTKEGDEDVATAAVAATAAGDDEQGGDTSTTTSSSSSSDVATVHDDEARRTLAQHVQLMRCINDGAVGEGAVFVHVPYEEGGYMPGLYNDNNSSSHRRTQRGGAGDDEAASREAAGEGDEDGEPCEVDNNNNDDDKDDDEVVSLHSESLISVGSIAHLQQQHSSSNSSSNDDDDDDDAASSASASDADEEDVQDASASGVGEVAVPHATTAPSSLPCADKGSDADDTAAVDATTAAVATTTQPPPPPPSSSSPPPSPPPRHAAPPTTLDVDGTVAAATAAANATEVRTALALDGRRGVPSRSSHAGEGVLAGAEGGSGGGGGHAGEGGGDVNGVLVGGAASLRDVYVRCCDWQRVRPNSHLLHKLPADAHFTPLVEELDLTANYVGHAGFVAVLLLLRHLPRLRRVFMDDMQLDNTDVENLCEVLATHTSVREVYLRHNPKITLPSMRFLSRLLRSNTTIRVLALDGTRLGAAVIARLQADAAAPRHVAATGAAATAAATVAPRF